MQLYLVFGLIKVFNVQLLRFSVRQSGLKVRYQISLLFPSFRHCVNSLINNRNLAIVERYHLHIILNRFLLMVTVRTPSLRCALVKLGKNTDLPKLLTTWTKRGCISIIEIKEPLSILFAHVLPKSTTIARGGLRD